MTTLALPTINLLPAPRQVSLRRNRRIRRWVAAVAVWCAGVAGVLSAVIAGNRSVSVAAELDATNNAIAIANKDLIEAVRKVQANNEMLDAANAAGNHPDWSVLLQLLAGAKSDEVVLEHCELNPRPIPTDPKTKAPLSDLPGSGGYTLTIDGIASSQAAAFDFAGALEKLDLFESVNNSGTHARDSISADAPGLHLINFEISCVLSDNAAGAARLKSPKHGGQK